MALEIVSPLLLLVNTPPTAVVVVIDALLKARVPPEIVKKVFCPVVPEFVNNIESIATVPTLLVVVAWVAPPNTSEYVPDVVGAFTAGFQLLVPDQVPFPPLPVHELRVPAEAAGAAQTTNINRAMSARLRE